ncbi:hypothetical protein [Pelagibacterium xiamenense]|uniref:hypothetical protein n=1 Tax=Pelagibacterium xiamenense TaxID=2901140 RepID=UPI001E3182C0|nr:hypothetical protein [Pelagibacterium xiamenense]MCD7061391.1 hypothetical protein [Pelagibacterium xiamenense]
MILSDLTLQLLAFRLAAGLLVFTVQGAAIAAMAVALGDAGPRHDGRLSGWPAPHIDMLGLGAILLTGFGWARPVAIEADALRGGRWGLVGAVVASSAVLLLLGVLLLQLAIPLLTVLPPTPGLVAVAFVRTAARICVWIALFSLLPLPPLAGAHFLAALGVGVPRQAGPVVGLVLFAASLFGVTRMVLKPVYDVVAPVVLGGAA